MIELANDIAIRCKKCGEIIYRQRELFCPSETFYERNMGFECVATIEEEEECPDCGNSISFSLNASAYASDIHNDWPVIDGGEFLERPLMQIVDEEDEGEFFERAYNEADRVQKLILDSARNREHMYCLHFRDFEEMVEQIFIDKGFETELTPATRDHGRDIIARKDYEIGVPIVIYIECKRYDRDKSVGEPIIRGLYGTMIDAHINKGMLVTSSYFSKDAKVFAQRQGDLIDLIDGDDLYKMVRKNAFYYYESMR